MKPQSVVGTLIQVVRSGETKREVIEALGGRLLEYIENRPDVSYPYQVFEQDGDAHGAPRLECQAEHVHRPVLNRRPRSLKVRL